LSTAFVIETPPVIDGRSAHKTAAKEDQYG
jgi:hypothetical protein